MMFQKIDITNFGSFSNFQWAATLPDFKKVNLLYGRNYSGKTTLSRIFRCLETKELHINFEKPQFTLTYSTGTSQTITQADLQNSPVSDRVFVYNSDFVKANLSWLHDESAGNILPFAVAGEINNDIVKKIERFEGKKEGELVVKAGLIERVSNRLNTRTEKFNNENKLLTSKTTNLNSTLTSEAASIKNNTDYVRQNEVASYNKNRLTNEINDLKNQLDTRLSDTDKEKYRSTIKEQNKAKVDEKPEKKPKFEDRFNTTKELLAKTITVSQPIESLLHSHALEKWVGDGIDLHRNQRESCAFCDSQLSPEDWQNRWSVLDAHFSQASKELTEQINAEIKTCENAKTAITGYLNFEPHLFYAEFAGQINELGMLWSGLKQVYSDNLDALIQQLNKKLEVIRKNEDLSAQIAQLQDNSDDILTLISNFNQVVEQNNKKTNELPARQSEAKKALRFDHIKEFIETSEYFATQAAIKDLELKKSQVEKLKNKAQSRLSQFQSTLRELRSQLSDESAAANSINEFLKSFFGHPELSIKPVVAYGSSKAYAFQVLRNGVVAKNLSEGECSLLAFCYFVAKVKDKLGQSQEPIIFIDDPMSSLDANHIFFVFSLIDAVLLKEVNAFEQIFISTHNLEFFKYLKRLNIIDKESKAKNRLSAFILERDTDSAISKMPDYMLEYVTEFQYLFKRIYEAAASGVSQSEQVYSLGNEMRKFLEIYLYFKLPHSKYAERMNAFFSVSDGQRAAVNRCTQEYSHTEGFPDRTMQVTDKAELQKVAKLILCKLKERDAEQFDSLCASVGVSPSQSQP